MIPLLAYILACGIYIMLMHFAVGIRKEFDVFLMAGIFVLGGVIGWYFQAYELGFVFAVIASLLLW